MACPPPSPSGRRLLELLEEQQEPFFLDLHLLEKGCSSRLLDGYDTALCWPAPATDATAVLKRLTSKKNTSSSARGAKKQQPAGGFLKLLLSKILHGKAAARQKKPAALQFSDSFKIASNPAAVKTAAGEGKKVDTGCPHSDSDSESSYSDDDEKQFSPVSVLEPHPFDESCCSPVHAKRSSPVNGKRSPTRNAALDILRELTQLLAKSDDLIPKDPTTAADDEEEDDDEFYYGGYRTSPKNGSRYDDEAYWEAHKAELAKVSELVAGEVPNARLGHADLLADREDVGAGLADAVLQALMQELVVDLGSC